MIPVLPVYPSSLCVTKSVHPGALPGPAYPYFPNNQSREVHTVAFVPGPWVKKSERHNVWSDSSPIILDGHNTGPGIIHVSPIMDNALLPVTIGTSSCEWPFVTFRRQIKGDGVVGFLPLIAPYMHCDSPSPGKPSSKEVQNAGRSRPGKKLNDKFTKVAEKRDAATQKIKRKLTRKKKAASAKTGPSAFARFSEKTGIEMPSINGQGKIYIPLAKTVRMQLSLMEILSGWTQVLIGKAFDALAGAMLKRMDLGGDALSRLDNDVARRLAMQSVNRSMKSEAAKRAARVAGAHLGRHLAVDTVNKAIEGVTLSVVLDGEIKLPYGLFSYNIAEGKGNYLFWGTFESSVPLDVEMLPTQGKGVKGWLADKTKDAMLQPDVDDIADSPHYAKGK